MLAKAINYTIITHTIIIQCFKNKISMNRKLCKKINKNNTTVRYTNICNGHFTYVIFSH